MESLRGIFPTAQSQNHHPKRDFLKENVLRIRKMQDHQRKVPVSCQNNNAELYGAPKQKCCARKIVKCCDNKPIELPPKNRSSHSLSISSSKVPINNLKKSLSTMSISSRCKDSACQTTDVNDDMFLKDTIIRYPSATAIRTLPAVSKKSKKKEKDPETKKQKSSSLLYKSHFSDNSDEHSQKMERHISNLSEFLDNGSITKQPSILKKPTDNRARFSYAAYMSDSDGDMIGDSNNGKPIEILDSSDDECSKLVERNAEEEKKRLLKAAGDDPSCPAGLIALNEKEREEALVLAQKKI